MKQYLIPHDGRFFKANLHAHSTFSDGRLTPAQMKGLYQTGGYSVIAFTDHNVLQWHKDLDAPNFLALCGYEVDVCETAPDGYSRCCHLCAISRDPEHAVLIPRLLVQGGMDQGEAVSAYGVTFGMTLPMLLLPTAFLSALGLVLTPKLSQYSALGQKEAIRRQVKRSVGAANLILIPALALLAVLGSAIGQSLYRDDRVGDHLPLLALGVLFSCWQTLSACVLSGVNRQGASAGIALAADSVQLVLTCLTVGRWGMGGYAFSFALSALLGAVLSWRVVSREIGLSLPVFSWFTAPTLAACLAASCGDLMETVLLRAGLVSFPAAVGGLCFGLLLYLAALQAMGAGSKGGGLPLP